ncbi:hypothetical protein MTR67_013863 [Solanum verrucosum]|uniref:Uncharacterized protein n=1 Tax=Solanum verrucosum TaxID=315347 RepID=A0AAF0QDC0_SOLVR|nr:hypothetical protein MTR67_013863 [Solanum verrucosum]
MKRTKQAQTSGESCFGPTTLVGQKDRDNSETHLGFNEKEQEDQIRDINGLSAIKSLASQFLEAVKAWENSTEDVIKEKMAGERVAGEKNHMQTQKSKQIIELSSMSEHSEEEIATKDFNQTELQLQQILDAEPVAMQNLTEEDLAETKASNWVNSHILELSNTYGVAFEGFEKETLALLMRIDGRKTELDNKRQGKAITTPKSRGIGKNELKKLQPSLNKEVEGATNRGRVLNLTFK